MSNEPLLVRHPDRRLDVRHVGHPGFFYFMDDLPTSLPCALLRRNFLPCCGKTKRNVPWDLEEVDPVSLRFLDASTSFR